MAMVSEDPISMNDVAHVYKQLTFVTGKGGVGKSTTAAALAQQWFERRGKACLIEFGDGEAGARTLPEGSGVDHLVIDPASALVAASSRLFGSGWVARLVVGNFAVKRVLRVSPGFREVAQLERVMHAVLADPERPVVVDLPATGHGVAWLRAPKMLSRLLRTGALHDLAQRIDRTVLDPEVASVVVVTLPEPLVLVETQELLQALSERVGLEASAVVVNRMPEDLPEEALAQAERLSELTPGADSPLCRLRSALRTRLERRSSALSAVKRFASAVTHTVWVPLFPGEPDLARVGEALRDNRLVLHPSAQSVGAVA